MQHQPDLLIMDEPTEGLDPLMQRAFFGLMREFQSRGGTLFMSSHVLPEVEELCDRVAIIRDGRLVGEGLVERLRRGRTRTMCVEFREPPSDGLHTPGVEVQAQGGRWWRLAVPGDINPLLRELAAHDLADMVFERPRLEELFVHYHRETPESDA